jgi:beta-glucosidase
MIIDKVFSMKYIYTTLTMLCVLTANAQRKPIESRVDSVLTLMSLEEKVGQMNQYNGFWNATGPAPAGGDAATKYQHLRNGWVGSVLNVQGVEEVRAMQRVAVEETRLGIPLIFACDVIHGYKTLSPIPLAEAASWNLDAIEKSARNAAEEATAHGLNWTFAPMVDISRDPRWGRMMEGAGEDTYLGARVASARVQGFQGSDLSAPNTMAACAKHFAGYGFVEAGRDYNTVDVSAYTLQNVIFPPFQAAVEAGAATFMNAFNTMNGIPATGNQALIETLKETWGFQGVLVSDWGSISEMQAHGFSRNLSEATAQAANARCDIDMESLAYVYHLADLVRKGVVAQARVDDAVRRVLRLKFQLGLMDDPYKYCQNPGEWTPSSSPWAEDAQNLAEESAVLLKNKGILPIVKGQRIALIGPMAAEKNSPLGNWRVSSEDHTAISLQEGLRSVKGFKSLDVAAGPVFLTGAINFPTEASINTSDTAGLFQAVRSASAADVAILAVGEHGFQSGEGRSRLSLHLPGLQELLIREVLKVQPHVVLVVYAGRPFILPEDIQAQVEGILFAWQPGTMGGPAIANLLMGRRSPSGRLPVTFPRSEAQIPLYYGAYNTGRPGPISEVFWSHYGDGPNTPQYPFGYGLTYSTVSYSKTELVTLEDGTLALNATVSNTGKVEVDEVVQVYMRDHHSAYGVRPLKQLIDFRRIAIKAGETKSFTFILEMDQLSVTDAQGEKHVEPGIFSFWIAPNSVEGVPATMDWKIE